LSGWHENFPDKVFVIRANVRLVVINDVDFIQGNGSVIPAKAGIFTFQIPSLEDEDDYFLDST
jgi:hypothetical protein